MPERVDKQNIYSKNTQKDQVAYQSTSDERTHSSLFKLTIFFRKVLVDFCFVASSDVRDISNKRPWFWTRRIWQIVGISTTSGPSSKIRIDRKKNNSYESSSSRRQRELPETDHQHSSRCRVAARMETAVQTKVRFYT